MSPLTRTVSIASDAGAPRPNMIACPATASAPAVARTGRSGPKSTRSTTSGWRTKTSRSKSPSRAAAWKASTSSRWRIRSAGASGAAPRTRRRARLASWRAASGVRSTIGAISSKGTANMSCRTKASRSAGDSCSRTTRSARPTESASSASCSGWPPSMRSTTGSGRRSSSGSSPRVLRARSMFRHTRATTVVSQPPRFSISSASLRLSRTQASCTASSASLSEPSMR